MVNMVVSFKIDFKLKSDIYNQPRANRNKHKGVTQNGQTFSAVKIFGFAT